MRIDATGSQYSKVYNEKKTVKGTKVEKDIEKKEKLSTKEVAATYERSDDYSVGKKPNADTIAKLKQESKQRIDSFKKMIYEMLEKQGYNFKTFMGVNVKDIKIEVDEETRLKAQKAISDGGEYSVDAVATRIVDFAKALSGGDKSKIGLLKDAVIKGFEEAKRMLGGGLPEISNKTYDEVMRRFDEWEGVTPTEEATA